MLCLCYANQCHQRPCDSSYSSAFAVQFIALPLRSRACLCLRLRPAKLCRSIALRCCAFIALASLSISTRCLCKSSLRFALPLPRSASLCPSYRLQCNAHAQLYGTLPSRCISLPLRCDTKLCLCVACHRRPTPMLDAAKKCNAFKRLRNSMLYLSPRSLPT